MNKYARIVSVLALSILLILGSCNILKAQSEPTPPVPVVYEQSDDTYDLNYFLPYAKSIVVNYSYENGGGLTAFVFQESFPLSGVRAIYVFENASEIASIQVIVRMRDNRSFTLTPMVVGLNQRFLPIVQSDGLPNNEFKQAHDGTIIILDEEINVKVNLLGIYDVMYVQLNDADGNAFYKIWNQSDYDENIPTTEVFGSAFGYVWNVNTLEINSIAFQIIRVAEETK